MSKLKFPVTAAVRVLRQHNVVFSHHLYCYQSGGGAVQGAQSLGINPLLVIKTLIMEDERSHPLIVLMHGGKQVSTKKLARFLAVKLIVPCDPKVANRHTGYLVGGTSPFGTRKIMPVYLEASIAKQSYVYINGGKRGYLVGMDPKYLRQILKPTLVQVAVEDDL
jgi:Cys-tRNA(Pro) deacylase